MHSNRAAWVQGVLLVAGSAAIALTLTARLHRPFDRDTLAIRVAQLQSSAAEAQLRLGLVIAKLPGSERSAQ